MNRSFVLGLASASGGIIAGGLFKWVGAGAHGFVTMFALVTVMGCLASGISIGRHVSESPDGFVTLADTFFAIATIVVLVAAVVFTLEGSNLAVAYGAGSLVVTLFALKQERHVSLSTAGLLSVVTAGYILAVPQSFGIAVAPMLLWAFACGCYVASLMAGEELETAPS